MIEQLNQRIKFLENMSKHYVSIALHELCVDAFAMLDRYTGSIFIEFSVWMSPNTCIVI